MVYYPEPSTLLPSGDTTGALDVARIASLLKQGPVHLAPGTFYANAPIQVPACTELSGSGGTGPTIYDELPFVGGTIIKAVAAWSGGSNAAPAIVQANGTGVRMRDFWVDGSALWTGNSVTGATCDGVNDNTGFHSFCLRNVGVRMASNNGFTFAFGESVVFQCGANITWGDGFHGGFIDSQVIDCFAQGCGLNGTGSGYAILASQCKFIGCRGDLSQFGFFISAYTGATNADMVQLIGCSTQRNNQDGVHISTPVANGTPILISGCSFDSDGVNGTLTTVSGGTPAGSGGYATPGTGLTYAGISVGGGSTVIIDGVTQTCGTGDSIAPCPQYGVVTYALNGHNPVLVSVNDSFLNSGGTLVSDQTAVATAVGLNCFGYSGAVFSGQAPSRLGVLDPVSTVDFAATGRLLTGCQAATMPPALCTVTCAAPTSGTLAVTSIMLKAGMSISNMLLCTDGTAETGGSHGWYVLMDTSMKVLAVTADKTAATFWGNGFQAYSLPFTASYTVPTTGRYLVGVCIVASQMPTFSGQGALRISAPNNAGPTFAPAWIGTSSTGQTTPPALGATMAALANVGNSYNYYAELS